MSVGTGTPDRMTTEEVLIETVTAEMQRSMVHAQDFMGMTDAAMLKVADALQAHYRRLVFPDAFRREEV